MRISELIWVGRKQKYFCKGAGQDFTDLPVGQFLHSCHREEPTDPAFGGPDDKLRDEAIHWAAKQDWIASRSLSSGAHSRDPLARNDEVVIVVIATTALKAMNL